MGGRYQHWCRSISLVGFALRNGEGFYKVKEPCLWRKPAKARLIGSESARVVWSDYDILQTPTERIVDQSFRCPGRQALTKLLEGSRYIVIERLDVCLRCIWTHRHLHIHADFERGVKRLKEATPCFSSSSRARDICPAAGLGC